MTQNKAWFEIPSLIERKTRELIEDLEEQGKVAQCKSCHMQNQRYLIAYRALNAKWILLCQSCYKEILEMRAFIQQCVPIVRTEDAHGR